MAAQGGFWAEIRKIPPVTRFLCASSLAVSLPVMAQLVSPWKVVYVQQLVTKKWEIWRLWSSFFLGSSGINYIFDFVMLYRTSDGIESANYASRSADYAWHLLLSAISIIALNTPLHSYTHTRPLLLCLTYLASRLAPPGAQTSLMGLITVPYAYWPYIMIGMDFAMGGPAAAASAVSGAIVGHMWWYGLFETRVLEGIVGRAPGWLRSLVGDGSAPNAGPAGPAGGVHVIPPRQVRQATAGTGGHNWGTGHRLGTD
ncbi:DER1-domain-containing protein [Punctularia strigosozonata HHB-11173 SS5]|uniref:DER1-domain-containing protein n=1 Tax=Punctularia strigosozonata (strain HHB-11173) TaxID=741275 RepID=UPI00044172D8|nr:DER1-domain-containing protein [Punctularia strigosozonata HHB-11173 SS5]EIN08950.1 DER1-domain-containing protein [Punctularia strigosozonata HHB-11173 SS5]